MSLINPDTSSIANPLTIDGTNDLRPIIDEIIAGIKNGTYDVKVLDALVQGDIDMQGSGKEINIGANKFNTGQNNVFTENYHASMLALEPNDANMGLATSGINIASDDTIHIAFPIPKKVFNVKPTMRKFKVYYNTLGINSTYIDETKIIKRSGGSDTTIVDYTSNIGYGAEGDGSQEIYFTTDGQSGTPVALDADADFYRVEFICKVGAGGALKIKGIDITYDLVP